MNLSQNHPITDLKATPTRFRGVFKDEPQKGQYVFFQAPPPNKQRIEQNQFYATDEDAQAIKDAREPYQIAMETYREAKRFVMKQWGFAEGALNIILPQETTPQMTDRHVRDRIKMDKTLPTFINEIDGFDEFQRIVEPFEKAEAEYRKVARQMAEKAQ